MSCSTIYEDRCPVLNHLVFVQGDTIVTFNWLARTEYHKAKFDPGKWFYSYGNQIIKTKGLATEKPLEGLYTVKSITGSIIEQGSFHNGLKEGRWIRWNKNGTISSINNYTFGTLSGISEFYDTNGKIFAKEKYKDGLLYGKRIEYADDTIKLIQFYKQGKLKNMNFIRRFLK